MALNFELVSKRNRISLYKRSDRGERAKVNCKISVALVNVQK